MRSRNYRYAMGSSLLAVLAVTGAAGCGPGDQGGPDGPDQVTHLVTSRFPRLSHPQWENTVQDLFQLLEPPGLATSFNADPPLGRFDNNTARLTMTGGLWQDYQRAAETMAEQITGDAEALARIMSADLRISARCSASRCTSTASVPSSPACARCIRGCRRWRHICDAPAGPDPESAATPISGRYQADINDRSARRRGGAGGRP
jgi:hypothetical protein